jgi:hypothetical protein
MASLTTTAATWPRKNTQKGNMKVNKARNNARQHHLQEADLSLSLFLVGIRGKWRSPIRPRSLDVSLPLSWFHGFWCAARRCHWRESRPASTWVRPGMATPYSRCHWFRPPRTVFGRRFVARQLPKERIPIFCSGPNRTTS